MASSHRLRKAGIIEPASTLVLGELDESLHPIFLDEGPAQAVVRGEAFDLTDDRLAVGGRLLGVRTPRASTTRCSCRCMEPTSRECLVGAHGRRGILRFAAARRCRRGGLRHDYRPRPSRGRSPQPHDRGRYCTQRAGGWRLPSRLPTTSARAAVATSSSGCKTGECLSTSPALQVANYQLVATCTAPTARGVDAETLADAVREAGGQADAVFDVESAFDHVYNQAEDDDLIVVAGSNPVVGIVRTLAEDL